MKGTNVDDCKSTPPTTGRIDEYLRLANYARDEIQRVGGYYKTAAWGVITLFALGGLLFWGSLRDMKQEMRDRIEANIKIQNQLVADRIDAEFQTKRISTLVQEKAKEHLDNIAPPLIHTYIELDLAKRIDSAETDLRSLRTLVDEGATALQNANEAIDFMQQSIALQSDRREAFTNLWRLSQTEDYPYKGSALSLCFSAFTETVDKHNLSTQAISPLLAEYERLMPDFTNVTGITSADRFRAGRDVYLYNNIAPLVFVWNNTELDESFRINMMAEAMTKDPSLTAAYYAAKRLADKFELYWGPTTQFDPIIDWWRQNKTNYPTSIQFDN